MGGLGTLQDVIRHREFQMHLQKYRRDREFLVKSWQSYMEGLNSGLSPCRDIHRDLLEDFSKERDRREELLKECECINDYELRDQLCEEFRKEDENFMEMEEKRREEFKKDNGCGVGLDPEFKAVMGLFGICILASFVTIIIMLTSSL